MDLAGVTAGVVVLVLLTLLGLTAGATTGVVLKRRTKKRKAPRERGNGQEKSNIIDVGGATVNAFDVVYDDTCIDGRAVVYQELDEGTLEYASVYTPLRWGTLLEELDRRGKEEEHHYQNV